MIRIANLLHLSFAFVALAVFVGCVLLALPDDISSTLHTRLVTGAFLTGLGIAVLALVLAFIWPARFGQQPDSPGSTWGNPSHEQTRVHVMDLLPANVATPSDPVLPQPPTGRKKLAGPKQ
jgi:hypothetical protein